jgi:hypothetical protein
MPMILVKIQQRLGLAQLLKEELVGLCLLETSYLNFTQEEVLLEALQRITTGLRLNPLKAEDGHSFLPILCNHGRNL